MFFSEFLNGVISSTLAQTLDTLGLDSKPVHSTLKIALLLTTECSEDFPLPAPNPFSESFAPFGENSKHEQKAEVQNVEPCRDAGIVTTVFKVWVLSGRCFELGTA